MNPPRVDVLVPAWNSAALVEKTLASAAAQDYPNFRVIVSDDASPDDTYEVCHRFAESDPRFRVIRQEENHGWVGNVNALFEEVEGDLVFILPHDDLIDPTFLSKHVMRLESSPEAVMAFSDLEDVQEDGSKKTISFPNLDGVTDPCERAMIMARKPLNWWVPYKGVFRAEAIKKIGGMRADPLSEMGAGWAWLLALALLGEWERIPEPLCQRIRRKGSLTKSFTKNALYFSAGAVPCALEVARSNLTGWEKTRVYGTLLGMVSRYVRWDVKRRVKPLLSRSESSGSDLLE